MRKRVPALLAMLVASLAVTGSAVAFDCIRVSSSLQGLTQSTKSGHWVLFDFSTPEGTQATFAGAFETEIDLEDAACFAEGYAEAGQPLFFALGINVGGGVLASNNPNEHVLSDGRGIDHLEASGIVPAALAAADACGLVIPD